MAVPLVVGIDCVAVDFAAEQERSSLQHASPQYQTFVLRSLQGPVVFFF